MWVPAMVPAVLRLPIVLLIAAAIPVSTEQDQSNYPKYLCDTQNVSGLIEDERIAAAYVNELKTPLDILHKASANSQWDFNTNITDYNQNMSETVENEQTKKRREIGLTAKRFAFKTFQNVTLVRMFRRLNDIGLGILKDEEAAEANKLNVEMEKLYSSTEVVIGGKNMSLEPDLTQTMAKVGDYDALLEAWKKWHEGAGRPIRPLYQRFITIVNKSAVMNGYENLKDSWLENYETENITDMVDALWEEVSPLYKKLHAFVRKKLKEIYPNRIPKDGTIPAHLLGNMWAQSWGNLYNNISQGSILDVTPEMKKQQWNATKMFQTSEKFFTSLRMEPMTDIFWAKSMLTKPPDRNVVCHASAWDFATPQDFRIKMCTDITMDELFTVHHEMGHIAYFMQYFNQHPLFRDGANEGFHEAIGDLMALSVSTPSHLKMLGLLQDDNNNTVDFQLLTALDKVAFLPFGYLLDKWRWTLFTGETPLEQMNRKFWEYRIKYQGVSPPVNRSEKDFDPGAKFHVPANVPYLRYFVSFIIQFQFHEHLCNESKQLDSKKLHECDIYGKEEAGQILRNGLSLGSSKVWQDVFQIMAGTREMSASSIKKYFAPLETWLDTQLENETVGWDDAKVEDYMESGQEVVETSYSYH
ncbi:angiotensin-converting enzyme-like [Ornithodoros turicata]